MPSQPHGLPEGVHVFRYEAGDPCYEPPESAPDDDWEGNLNDLIGVYVRVEDLGGICKLFADRLLGNFTDALMEEPAVVTALDKFCPDGCGYSVATANRMREAFTAAFRHAIPAALSEEQREDSRRYTTEQARMRLREAFAVSELPQDGTDLEYFIRAAFPDGGKR